MPVIHPVIRHLQDPQLGDRVELLPGFKGGLAGDPVSAQGGADNRYGATTAHSGRKPVAGIAVAASGRSAEAAINNQKPGVQPS